MYEQITRSLAKGSKIVLHLYALLLTLMLYAKITIRNYGSLSFG